MSKSRSDKIIENSPVGYCIISADLELSFANKTLLNYFDLDIDQVMGGKWLDLAIEKNFLKKRKKAFTRWLKTKFSGHNIANKLVLKILDNSNYEFYVQIDPLENNQEFLVTIYPVSGTILLHHSRLTRTLNTEYRIAGKIQRNINDYIVDIIEGRYFKYHFKRLFMPSGILSGDIINVRTISRRYASLFLGDGKGHGLPAALYSSLIHSYLNMIGTDVIHGNESTAKLIEGVNKVACRDFKGTNEYYFFSGIFGLIDGNTKNFRLTNAGHPYPVLIRDRKVSRLPSNGSLIGIDDQAQYTEDNLELRHNDTLIFFTDGVYDITMNNLDPDSEHDGLTDYLQAFMDQENSSAKGAIDYLIDSIHKFRSYLDTTDDISILQMHVEEKSGGH